MLKMADNGISFEYRQTVTIGGAVPKLLVCPQVILAITCTKFGRNLLKHCEAIASCTVFHEFCMKFVNTLYENSLVFRKYFVNFLPELSEDDKIGHTV